VFPSYKQFARWSELFQAVPIWIEPELPASDMLGWAHNLAGQESEFFFLHSASTGPQARYSYIALDHPRYTIGAQGGSLTVRYHAAGGTRHEALKIGNPLDRFEDWFGQFQGPPVDALPPFWGGAVGYFAYDSARYFDPALGRTFGARRNRPGLPATEKFNEFEFGIFDAVAVVDHALRRLWLVHTVLLPAGKSLSPVQLEKIYRGAQDRLRRYAVEFQKAAYRRKTWGAFRAAEIRSNRSEAAYRLMIRRAKGYIGSGDIYQCNLSQSFSSTWEGDPWSLYRRLIRINPSPYSALWRSGSRWIVSASPELLMRQQADWVETRPIAGTYPRPPDASDDAAILATLRNDAKERAEHIMLVDLERNDLGRVCRPGSVHVAESLITEIYSHVIHLVSDIRGQLTPGGKWKDVLRACFPGGTITGCPKIRCMELIERLEAQRRGPYCGSLGWIGYAGNTTFNILIRSIFLDKGHLSFPTGAGIVADSDPLNEYHETLHKARALQLALQDETPMKPARRKSP